MKSRLLGRGRELELGLGGAPKEMTNEGQVPPPTRQGAQGMVGNLISASNLVFPQSHILSCWAELF